MSLEKASRETLRDRRPTTLGDFRRASIRSDVYRRMIDLLVEARKAAGVTQTELGQRIGQRQTFISKVELDERRLDAAEYVMLARKA